MVDVVFRSVLPNYCAGCTNPIPCSLVVCERCESKMNGPMFSPCSYPHIDQAYAFWRYEPPMSEILRQYKFFGRHRISKYLAKIVFKTIYAVSLDMTLPVVPVPTTTDALRRRGFDPNRLILRHLSKMIDFKLLDALVSRGSRQQQSLLKMEERKQNVRESFLCRSEEFPERVILFDDVVTTGSTASECAKMLKAGGVVSVVLISVARSVV